MALGFVSFLQGGSLAFFDALLDCVKMLNVLYRSPSASRRNIEHTQASRLENMNMLQHFGDMSTCDISTCDISTCDISTCDISTCDISTCA